MAAPRLPSEHPIEGGVGLRGSNLRALKRGDLFVWVVDRKPTTPGPAILRAARLRKRAVRIT
jgi:hypothetical protein